MGIAHRRLRLAPAPLAALVAVAGVALSAAGWIVAGRVLRDADAVRFAEVTQRVAADVQTRLDLAAGALRAAQGLYQASREVEREEFREFAASIAPDLRRHGVRYLAFFQSVPRDRLAAFAEEMRRESSGFEVQVPPAAVALEGEARVMVFAEPSVAAGDAIGYDAGAVPALRSVFDDARDSDEPRLSSRRRSPGAGDEDPSVFLCLPVFGRGPVPATTAERRAAVRGWVGAAISTKVLLGAVAKDSLAGIDLEVFDGRTPSLDSLLFDRDGHLGEAASVAAIGRDLTQTREVPVTGRTWTLRCSALPEFHAARTSRVPLLSLFGGLAGTALATALVWSLATTRGRAERLAEERSASLRKALADLEAQHDVVRSQADELLRARDEALAATRAKSDFLATMTHEIRTPMTGVVGMTSLLLDSRLTPEQREYATHVRASADQLLAIVNDLLDFSKFEAGRMLLDLRPFALASVLDDAVATVEPIARAKGLAIEVRTGEGVPARLLGDSGRLRQVLVNLAANAVKFSERGPVVVEADATERGPDGALLRFRVTDRGIGIPPDVLPRLFEPFVQADASTTRKFGGTGLGLALCRRIVGLMGGRIGAESRPGEGSVFWFEVRLPVEP